MWNIFGYLGSLMILFGFYMVTRGKWRPNSYYYLLFNLAGACLLAIYQIKFGAYASVLLNVVFAIVALLGIARRLKRKKK